LQTKQGFPAHFSDIFLVHYSPGVLVPCCGWRNRYQLWFSFCTSFVGTDTARVDQQPGRYVYCLLHISSKFDWSQFSYLLFGQNHNRLLWRGSL